MSEPIIGQADIHKMIMSLNFRDCHAKIRMVDAQATLGDGVVIQVANVNLSAILWSQVQVGYQDIGYISQGLRLFLKFFKLWLYWNFVLYW